MDAKLVDIKNNKQVYQIEIKGVCSKKSSPKCSKKIPFYPLDIRKSLALDQQHFGFSDKNIYIVENLSAAEKVSQYLC